jgi:hypothetical protein
MRLQLLHHLPDGTGLQGVYLEPLKRPELMILLSRYIRRGMDTRIVRMHLVLPLYPGEGVQARFRRLYVVPKQCGSVRTCDYSK